MKRKVIDVERRKRNQSKPMSNHFVVQAGRVLSNFNQVDSHRGNFGNHDTPQSVSNGQICVVQLKFDRVLEKLENFDLWEVDLPSSLPGSLVSERHASKMCVDVLLLTEHCLKFVEFYYL